MNAVAPPALAEGVKITVVTLFEGNAPRVKSPRTVFVVPTSKERQRTFVLA